VVETKPLAKLIPVTIHHADGRQRVEQAFMPALKELQESALLIVV
jgi:hypothetical protein